MRTRLSICNKKVRYRSKEEAMSVAGRADYPLRVYLCDRCWQYHLTSRTKGKHIAHPL